MLFWVLPIFVCSWLADRQGKDLTKVFVCALLLGWVGGILALVLLEGGERQGGLEAQWEAEEEELERQRKAAALRAMGKDPELEALKRTSSFSAAKRKELEGLLGGKKKG